MDGEAVGGGIAHLVVGKGAVGGDEDVMVREARSGRTDSSQSGTVP